MSTRASHENYVALLALMNPKRTREEWEIVTPEWINGKEPGVDAEADLLPCEFEGLTEFEAERALPGVLYCLAELADHLVANVSFGELFRTKRDELKKAFGGLDKPSPGSRRFRHFGPADPVRMATPSEAAHATTTKTLSDEKKRITLGDIAAENDERGERGRVIGDVEGYRKMREAAMRGDTPPELARAASEVGATATQPADVPARTSTPVPQALPLEP